MQTWLHYVEPTRSPIVLKIHHIILKLYFYQQSEHNGRYLQNYGQYSLKTAARI